MQWPKLHRPRFTWVCLVLLVAIASVVYWVTFADFGDDGRWIHDVETVFSSPSGEHVALVVNEHFEPYLGGAPSRVEILVGEKSDSRDKFLSIMRADGWDEVPVAWVSDNKLVITLDRVRKVYVSLREAAKVTIVYHLDQGLLEANYRKRLDEGEQKREEALRQDNSTRLARALSREPGAPSLEKDQADEIRKRYSENLAELLKQSRDGYERFWAEYREFQIWARKNTDKGEP
jgi:hypothetical protein